MNKFVRFIIYALIFLLVIFLGLVLFTQLVYAQEAECIWVFDDNDEDGYYDTFDYTDPQGRDVCKVRVVFHQPAEGDPNGAVFTESGEVNGYTADFNGASVHVWRSGSPYSISHSKVWVLEEAPPPTEIPPTEVTPVPTDTEVPTMTITASGTPPDNTPTWTLTTTPLTPTWTATVGTGTPVTPTLIPPVTNMPSPTPEQPGTTPGQPGKTQVPMLPQTGFGEMTGDNMGLYFGIAFLCILVIFFARRMRGA